MHKYTSIEEFLKDYEKYPESYNMMVNIQNIQDMGTLYKPVINMAVMELEKGELYVQDKPGKDPWGKDYKETRYSITRKGLLKIANAAKATFGQPTFTYIPEQECYLCTTTMRYVGIREGDWQYTTCSKDAPLTKNGSKGTYKNADALRKSESGAQDACIRQAFAIQGHYSLEDATHPFVMAFWMLDDAIDEVRQGRIAAGTGATQMLFDSRQNGNIKQLESSKVVDTGSGEVLIDGK